MLKIELSVDKATNGFVVYNGEETTICTDGDAVVEVLQMICKEDVVWWIQELLKEAR